jgi:hypothetical protein
MVPLIATSIVFEPVRSSTLSDYPFSITGEDEKSQPGNGIDALTMISFRASRVGCQTNRLGW